MFHSESARERARQIDERLARLRAQKDQLLARASHAERRRAARQRFVVGRTVLAALENGTVPALESRADLERWLDGQLTRASDRAAFGLGEPTP